MRPRVLTNQIFSFIVMNQIFSFKLLNLLVLHVFLSASDNLIMAGLLLPTHPFSPQPRLRYTSPATSGNLSDKPSTSVRHSALPLRLLRYYAFI